MSIRGLAEKSQLRCATMLSTHVANTMRQPDITRFMSASVGERQDVIERGISPLNGLMAHLADTAVALPDVRESHWRNEPGAFPGAPPMLKFARYLWVCGAILAGFLTQLSAMYLTIGRKVSCQLRAMCALICGIPLAQPLAVRRSIGALIASIAKRARTLVRFSLCTASRTEQASRPRFRSAGHAAVFVLAIRWIASKGCPAEATRIRSHRTTAWPNSAGVRTVFARFRSATMLERDAAASADMNRGTIVRHGEIIPRCVWARRVHSTFAPLFIVQRKVSTCLP